jgi:hypothetical protein
LSSEKKRILVYVQALPSDVATSGEGSSQRAKSFVEHFQNSPEFALTHSSKVALSRALLLGTMDVTAIGYAPVLHEAIARGASTAISVPLCDTPYEQAKSFPEGNSQIIIGENPDGPFGGASLAGALVALRGYPFRLWDEEKPEYLENSIVLVKDLLLPTPSIDARRIKRATEEKFDAEAVLGSCRVSSVAGASARYEVISGNPVDLSAPLIKRLRRNILTA